MISYRDEVEIQKTIFYIVYTCIYFSIILLILHWTEGIYQAGNHKFQAVFIVIVIAEIVKYLAGSFYFKKGAFNLDRKHEDFTLLSFVRNLSGKGKMQEGCKTVLTVLAMTVVYFVFTVLYGAEVFDKHEETLMFSELLSVLTVFPICINLGSSSIVKILLGYKPSEKLEMLLYQNFYLTLVGAWLGAFVIPLDWDRPWQVWPIPCSIGAMLGFLLSHIFMSFQIRLYPLAKKFKNTL